MKITKYLAMMAAVVGVTAACQKEEFVTFNPEDVVAPVLHAVEDIVVTADNKETGSVTFSWDAADFGVKTQVFYSLDMAKGDKVVSLFTGLSGTSAVVSYDNINNKAFNDLGIASGEAGEVTFTLGAKLNVGETYYAAAVTAKVTPTAAEKVYPKLWVVGSYNGWAHDASNLFLYNYTEDDDFYSGVIDFGEEHADNQFKITGGGWGNDEHSATGDQPEEAASVSMVAGGGDNISAWKAKRYYHLTFSRNALTVTKNYSFDQVGIIGLNGDWENDIVMTYSPAKQRFYADVEVAAATEFKFRMDADWGVNFGGDMKALVGGGDNIKVEAGNYRVYFNMNNLEAISCTLDANMFGKPEAAPEQGGEEGGEGGDDAPVENVGWGIVGSINEWGGSGADIDMKVGTGWLVAAGVELADGDEIKFRLDGGWDANFGGTFAADAEVALVAGGDNFKPAAGTYDIYLNPDVPAAYFMTAGAAAPAAPQTWGIVGTTNNWGGDDLDMGLTLDETETYWVRKGVELPDGGEIKFRLAHSWDVNLGGTFSANASVVLAAGGDNLKTVAGTYDVYLDVVGEKAYFMTDGKTPADAGEAEVVIVDYSNCQMELVGSGVVEQTGSAPDTAWTWGNVLTAANDGKPAKEGDAYTWTWSGVQLSADGWKIRTLNAAESGGVSNFDLGDGAVDKTASPNAQESADGNIYVTAGTYNITLVIDAANNTKTVTIVAA